jgi:TBCC domain-containing protein 1
MTDELAWLYFETFDVVSEVEVGARVRMLQMMARCTSQEERDHLRRKVSVDAPRFFLFLFLQNAPRHSLKASLISGEEWPSVVGERRPQSSEYAHLEFLKSHVSAILHLISDTDEDSVYLTVEGLSALDFAVEGARGRSPPQPLAQLASLPTEIPASGYSEATGRFFLPQLEHWVSSHLSLSPHGPHAIRCGSRDRHYLCFRSDTLGRIASNSSQATATGQACVLLHKISKQTLAKVEEGLTGNTVHIDNCRSSRIYLLAPMKSVHVERCSHCLLVVGAVEMSLTISNCDSLEVVAACRRLHVSSCSLCNFHLLTVTRPVIGPPSHQLTFAPYNTHYPQLGKHLEQCGLCATFNLWDHPICTGLGDNDEVWTELDPDLFRPFSIPFHLTGDTQENPCELPAKYREALDRRKQRTSEWYLEVKAARLGPEQARRLQTCVQTQFQDWLDSTGHGREIRELELPKTRTQRTD